MKIISAFASSLKDPNREDVSSWYEIYKLVYPNVMHIDRFSNLQIPYATHGLDELKLSNTTNHGKTYGQCCLERARELFEYATSNNKKIGLLYSGGIDSTAILTAFLQILTKAEIEERLEIFMNQDSINENPNFYYAKIRYLTNLHSSEKIGSIINDTNYLIVDGEHNDQLFGADLLLKFVDAFGFKFLELPYTRWSITKCLTHIGMSDKAADIWFDFFNTSALSAPAPVATIYQFFWWINFNFKWQSVFLRIAIRNLHKDGDNLNIDLAEISRRHFFASEDFQIWSIHNPEEKIRDSWFTYKYAAKEFINNFYSDPEYFKYKIKMPSLSFLFFAKDVPLIVTADFKAKSTFNKDEFIVENNFFNRI